MRINLGGPLISASFPTKKILEEFRRKQRALGYSYPQAGATRANFPHGFSHDRNTIVLGQGEKTFRKAEEILRSWRFLPKGWMEVYPPNIEQQAGALVTSIIWAYGFWWVNALKIVYRIEESGTQFKKRSGFAYGTLDAHAEMGEEIFAVSWHTDDSVTFDILAFSKPNLWLAKACKPLVRLLQRKFVRDAQKRMKSEL